MFDIIGGVGVLRDCMGRMGLEGGGGRYSCMLKIRYNDEDSKLAAILNNLRHVTNYFCRPSAILENLRHVTSDTMPFFLSLTLGLSSSLNIYAMSLFPLYCLDMSKIVKRHLYYDLDI